MASVDLLQFSCLMQGFYNLQKKKTDKHRHFWCFHCGKTWRFHYVSSWTVIFSQMTSIVNKCSRPTVSHSQPCSFMMLVLAGRWQVAHDQEETEQFLPHTFGFINAQTETTDEMGPATVSRVIPLSPSLWSLEKRDPITTNIYCSLIVLPTGPHCRLNKFHFFWMLWM